MPKQTRYKERSDVFVWPFQFTEQKKDLIFIIVKLSQFFKLNKK